VQAQANFVTLSNEEDGFAYAMGKFVLPNGKKWGDMEVLSVIFVIEPDEMKL
jgi:hypothetical protein